MSIFKPLSCVEAVVFDMDGLMFNTEKLSIYTWIQAGEHMNITINPDIMHQMRGRTSKDCEQIFLDNFPDVTKSQFDKLKKLNNDIIIEYYKYYGAPAKKGLYYLLGYLHGAKIPVALATSTSEPSARKLLKFAGLDKYFNTAVFGNQVTNGKPDPEIFNKAMSALSVTPQRCIILEDSLNGLKAARSSDAYTVMVPDLSPFDETYAPYVDATVDSLDEMVPIIKSLHVNKR